MIDPEQEAICRAIDQRLRDQSVLLQLQTELEDRQVVRLYWTGTMRLSSPTIQAVIVDDDRDDWEAQRRLAEQTMERDE